MEARLKAIQARRAELLLELEALDREQRDLEANAAQHSMPDDVRAAVQQAVTQQGCAVAQQMFDEGDEPTVRAMGEAVLEQLPRLLSDPVGTFFAQKVLERGTAHYLQRAIDVLSMNSHVVAVAASTPGTRALQRIMELAQNANIVAYFVNLLVVYIVPLSNDVNGCHVVQRAMTPRFACDKGVIATAITRNCMDLACNKQGCCVIQRCLELVGEPHRSMLVDEIIAHELELVQNAFGNYVVQHLLDRDDEHTCKRATQQLLHNIAALACNKFGSNVVEKCVRVSPPSVRQLLIDELTDPSVLPRLVQDSYANYVVQTAISSADDEQFQQLHAAIRPSFPMLRNSPYGVRIEAKIQRRLKDNARARQRKKRNEQQQQQVAAVTAMAPVHVDVGHPHQAVPAWQAA